MKLVHGLPVHAIVRRQVAIQGGAWPFAIIQFAFSALKWAFSKGSYLHEHTVQKFAAISKKFPTTNSTFLGSYMMVTIWTYKKNTNFTRKLAKMSNFAYNENFSHSFAY